VIRRGSSLSFCDVDVTDEEGRVVAKGIVIYKLG
jgi:acyl-coenzyme A thioesterase PaaI-like protein